MLYKVVERKNPIVPGTTKHYAYVMNMYKMDIEDLATRISASCTVTRHDCLAVLSALQEQVIYALQEGKRVHLGDIGSFRIVANGFGSDTPEKYTTDLIRTLKPVFTPNTTLKNALSVKNKAISLERIQLAPEVEEKEEEEGDAI